MKRFALLVLLAGCEAVIAFDTPRESGEQCSDGLDNDDNGMMDCEDPGCAGIGACLGCGDGTLDTNEECDDGNLVPNDGCNAACKIEVCGDGAVNPGEDCDDGNTDDTDGCVACKLATCGDGFVQAGVEQCDDANSAIDDGCRACQIERCGDGTPNTGASVLSVEFAWLASSCLPSADIEFQINGITGLRRIGDAAESCTCSPGTFVSGFGEASTLINGSNQFTVELPGAGQFLAWAVVILHTTDGDREVVVYEGQPGAAAARATDMCTGGFDENLPLQTISKVVQLGEECDDGNTNNNDGCTNECRVFNP